MKAVVRTLFLAALLSPARPAIALPSQVVYNVLIPNGPDLSDASELGVMMFDLDADTGGSCRYYVEWNNNNDGLPLSADCYIEERKPRGAASCVKNATRAVTTIIVTNRRQSCFGWDTNLQFTPVFLLVAGEDALGELDGVILYSAAATFPYAFRAELYI